MQNLHLHIESTQDIESVLFLKKYNIFIKIESLHLRGDLISSNLRDNFMLL
jgi:hypothetical protein